MSNEQIKQIEFFRNKKFVIHPSAVNAKWKKSRDSEIVDIDIQSSFTSTTLFFKIEKEKRLFPLSFVDFLGLFKSRHIEFTI